MVKCCSTWYCHEITRLRYFIPEDEDFKILLDALQGMWLSIKITDVFYVTDYHMAHSGTHCWDNSDSITVGC